MPNSNGNRKQLAQVREWDEAVLVCRDYGHAWKPGKWTTVENGSIRERVSKCMREPTTRTEGIARRTGELAYRRYSDRPEGYLAKPGIGRISVAQVRVEVLRRAGE